MELYQELLADLIKQGEIQIAFPNQDCDINALLESECYQTLQKIKAIISDDNLDDESCFIKIEKIICEFEAIGSNGGNRHDWG